MSKQSQYPKVNLLGVEVDALTMPQAIAFILDRAANPATPASYVVKPYVEFLDRAAGDPAVRQLLMDAELSLADGVALPWAATYLYGGRRNLWRLGQTLSWIALAPGRLSAQLPERASGINLAWPLLQAAAERHLSVFLIGSPAASTIKHTASTLAAAIPDLRIAGTQNGAATAPGGSLSAGWLDATATA
ncbi:MAG TPA: WecB/TagA/CpsF family glycosyltransferase, partial [Candidatus Saccharimonas sp.]|nr:WecB/TagA/CpsF family glycosyltransferase [Candidatus Saccharimonas sp.]